MDIQYNNHRKEFAARKQRFKQLKSHKREVASNGRLEPNEHFALAEEVNHAFALLKSNPHNSRFFRFIPADEYKDYLKEEKSKKLIK